MWSSRSPEPADPDFLASRWLRESGLSAGELGNFLCGGCQSLGRCRLGLAIRGTDDAGGVVGRLRFGVEHEGAGRVAHGGAVMAVFDEICGAVPLNASVLAVTADMQVSFRRPVPIERDLGVRAWPRHRDERGHWTIAAEITLPRRDDRVLAEATGRFVERDPHRHYSRFLEWLEE